MDPYREDGHVNAWMDSHMHPITRPKSVFTFCLFLALFLDLPPSLVCIRLSLASGWRFWLRRHGRWLSPSASAVISPSPSGFNGGKPHGPPPSWNPFSILTTPAPCSIHKPEMISVLPLCVSRDKTMPHSTTEHHPSHRSSIWDTKDEMLHKLPFAKRGLSLLRRSSSSTSLAVLFTGRLVAHQQILLPCVATWEESS